MNDGKWDLIYNDIVPVWVNYIKKKNSWKRSDFTDDLLQEARLKIFVLYKTKKIKWKNNPRSFIIKSGINTIIDNMNQLNNKNKNVLLDNWDDLQIKEKF
jgi:DNA-directed RNA polymerase specialized sigma24 family protein